MKIIKNRNQLNSIRIYERYNMMINIITFLVFCSVIYYLYFINTYLDNYKHKQFIISFYKNINLRLSLIALLFVFITGYFGKRFILLAIIMAFAYVISMIQLQQKYNIFTSVQSTKPSNVEHMANIDEHNIGLPAGNYNNLEINNLPQLDPLPYSSNTMAPDHTTPTQKIISVENKQNEHFSNVNKSCPNGLCSQSGIAYQFDMA